MLKLTIYGCIEKGVGVQPENKDTKTGFYSPNVTKVLTKWLKDHMFYPYPSEEERIGKAHSP